jgi:hypothetical protein
MIFEPQGIAAANALIPGGTPPTQLTLNPTSLNFGNVAVGVASSPQTVTVSNNTGVAITVPAISTTGTGYSQTNNCPASLVAGNSCTVNVTLTPATPGPAPGTLNVGTQTVSLTGTGISSTVLLGTGSLPGSGPGTIAFGAQPISTPSGIGTIQVTNTGTGNLIITSVVLSNTVQFSLVAPPSGADCRTIGTVTPGTVCFLAATFTPNLVQAFTGTISIVDNAPGSPQQVSLSGTGFSSTGPVPVFAGVIPLSVILKDAASGKTAKLNGTCTVQVTPQTTVAAVRKKRVTVSP